MEQFEEEQAGPVVALIARLDAVPQAQLQVARLLASYRDQVVDEPGNVQFLPYAAAADPASFWVYEEYRDERAFRAHLESPHNQEFNKAVGPLLRWGAARLRILSPISTEEVPDG